MAICSSGRTARDRRCSNDSLPISPAGRKTTGSSKRRWRTLSAHCEPMLAGGRNRRRRSCKASSASLPSLQRTCYAGERIVGVGTDQPNRPDDQHQNHGQHDGILGDILTVSLAPKPPYDRCHRTAPLSQVAAIYQGKLNYWLES